MVGALDTAINSPSGVSVGIGFAVPVDIVKCVVPSLISDGHYDHPSLGVEVAAIGSDIAAPDDWTQRGLLVVRMSTTGSA